MWIYAVCLQIRMADKQKSYCFTLTPLWDFRLERSFENHLIQPPHNIDRRSKAREEFIKTIKPLNRDLRLQIEE